MLERTRKGACVIVQTVPVNSNVHARLSAAPDSRLVSHIREPEAAEMGEII